MIMRQTFSFNTFTLLNRFDVGRNHLIWMTSNEGRYSILISPTVHMQSFVIRILVTQLTRSLFLSCNFSNKIVI